MTPHRGKGPGRDRWMVSYADFMTLLFALFVLLFASAQGDRASAGRISASVTAAVENGSVAPVLRRLLGTPKSHPRAPAAVPVVPQADPVEPLETVAKSLLAELGADIDAGKLTVALEPRGLVVSLREAAFFPSGTARFHTSAYPPLEKLAGVLAKLPNGVRLEGHTDSIPIHNSRFRSNWELSAARAITVMEFLRARFGPSTPPLAVAAYADGVPAETNLTPEGRARNRRVEIVILNGNR